MWKTFTHYEFQRLQIILRFGYNQQHAIRWNKSVKEKERKEKQTSLQVEFSFSICEANFIQSVDIIDELHQLCESMHQ